MSHCRNEEKFEYDVRILSNMTSLDVAGEQYRRSAYVEAMSNSAIHLP